MNVKYGERPEDRQPFAVVPDVAFVAEDDGVALWGVLSVEVAGVRVLPAAHDADRRRVLASMVSA